MNGMRQPAAPLVQRDAALQRGTSHSLRVKRVAALRRSVIPYLYVAPAVAIFGLFLAYPVWFAVKLAFHEWNGLTPLDQMHFIGLQNFANLFNDSIFQQALANTVIFTVATTLLQMAIAFVLAFTLWYFKPRFAGIMRAVFFFPTVLSMVMVGLTWQQLLALSGPLNSALSALAGHTIQTAWLADTHLVLWVLIWVSNWQWSGWTMVLYLAGMSGIPPELLEAARLDGAGTGHMVRGVVFPLLRHVTALALLLNIVGGFQVFDTIYVMTAGGPNHASEVLSTYAYWNAFASYGPGEMGYAAAITVVMLVILFVFALGRVRMSKLV